MQTKVGISSGEPEVLRAFEGSCDVHRAGARASWARDGDRSSIPRDKEHGGLCHVGGLFKDQAEGAAVQ